MRKYFWMLAVLPLFLGSCRHFWGKTVRGNGHIKTETRSVNSFKSVSASGATNVYISQGDEHSVKIEGDENLLPYIEVTQEGDRILVRDRPGFNLRSTGDIRVYVTAPVFNSIETSGACDIVAQNKITNPEELELKVSGVGDIKMELDAPKVRTDISGTGSVDLKGQTKDIEITLSGVGHAHCFDLLAENASVNISGAGSADIFASIKLDAEVSGVGSVNYKGNAQVSEHVSGAGSVSKVN
ncbi:MAG: head GIN domain-containing protein [Bacteroidota bacterium]|nr:head GIN domain-containing protein [Bacteroidota bacterium]MDP4217246.1 head GIN domain-containing protein [Bacteroidota bacterium]MDP4244923.1 head GIN domain-containing protein [Bacteroidota bacterium]MDP4255947.1 head GIN domain-containing protein [Bacteroidota bacterium]MDP4257577.1 head GIN domain-containing protein [Bacteroidota bacterium]